jgi:hypothetical protein
MSDVKSATPWWIENWADDYTRSRNGKTYKIDDKIGKQDYQKYELSTDDPTTVSGKDGKVLV